MKVNKVWLAILAVIPVFAFAGDYDSVVDDSVVGYWRFNDPSDYGKDSSGHGSGIVQWNNSASGGTVSSDWSRGGGCLELPRTVKETSWFKTTYNYGTVAATVTTDRRFSMSRQEPGWTVATWVRGSEDFVKSVTGATLFDFNEDTEAFKNAIGDGKWHPLVIVYRPNSASDFYHVYVDGFDGNSLHDITSGGTDNKGSPAWHVPLSVGTTQQANDTVTLGGELGGKISVLSISADFFGGLDDCLILDRELGSVWQGSSGERELFRLVKTGETFVFSNGSGTSLDMFSSKGNWSNEKAPSAGIPYMIENGCEVKSSTTATFAGKSLSVGRTEKLYGIKSVGGSKEVIVDNTVGKLTQQGANTTLTIDDLVLNDGTLTSAASGQRLVGNIRVRAAASNPFKVSVASGTYSVSGTMTGTGGISKVGSGVLDLSGLTELTAKVSLAEGSLRLSSANPTLSGYAGGTLLVGFDENAGTATAVTMASAWTGAFAFKLDGTPSRVGRYAVVKVPSSVKTVTAADFDNQTVCANGMTARTKVVAGDSDQTVYVECIPTADLNGSPVLGFE